MIFLPNETTNYEAREALGDIDSLVLDVLHPDKRSELPTFPEARRRAISVIATEYALKYISRVCIRCDGAICLTRFDARGAYKTIWNFSSPDGKWRQNRAANVA